ncbi:hypothetical protein C1646_819028 [Rhizophagus diaphanus]|nr:hypothetical protein C1646_819028 [Rhizophagus diaphanus] [Rhizophagus sp. MUCL 43196]
MYPITCTAPINNQRMNIQIIVIKKSPNRYSRYNRFLLLITPILTLISFAWITGHCVDINDLDTVKRVQLEYIINLGNMGEVWKNGRDDEYLIGGSDGGTLTTTSILTSLFAYSTPPVTNTIASTNTNNIGYFNHSNLNELNSMTK